jgi:ABC-type transporter Mla subunit MlaD
MVTAAKGAIQWGARHRGVVLGALAALVLTGCGSSKVSQCNDLAAVVNQTQTFMPEFETDIQAFSESAAQVKNLDDIKAAASQYTAAVDKVVTNLNTLVSDLEAVSLQDETLAAFRDEYIGVVQGFSTALEEASQAMDMVVTVASEDDLPATIEASQTQTVEAVSAIETLSQQEAQLISDVNTYCGATQAPAPTAAPETPEAPATPDAPETP